MLADYGVLLGFDQKACVFLGNSFHGFTENGQIVDMLGKGGDGIEQGYRLIALMLMSQVEHIFQFRIVVEHALIEVFGQRWAGGNQQGNSTLDHLDSVLIQHKDNLKDSFKLYVPR